MRTENLFPTPVSFFEYGSFTEDELKFIKELPVRPNDGNRTSEDSYLFKQKELSAIYEFCLRSTEEYLASIYAPREKVKPYITQSWTNYATKGEFHHRHQHANSIVSGVLYIQAQENTDKIYFYKNEYQPIKIPTETYNPYNSESWWLSVKTGQLIMFPSDLTHSVQTIETDETRISLAFNTFLTGYLGDEKQLTGLHLGA